MSDTEPDTQHQARVSPLSYAEERLWFLHHFAPDSPIYNTFVCFRVRGALDVEALRAAFGDLARRHDTLRTTYAQRPEGLLRVVAAAGTIPFEQVDLGATPAEERDAAVLRHANQELRRPFALDRGPLARATLYRLSRAEHVVLLVWHHIIVDIMSLPVLHGDLDALYTARSAGRTPALPTLPIQFGDFARQQREQMLAKRFDGQIAYWKQQLGGTLPILQMPTDRPRPTVQTNRGAWHEHRLPADLNQRLKELAGREGVSFFMVLLAAYQVFLHRYARQEEIVVGTPIQVRTANTRGLIGCFLNTLALRTDLAADPTFRDLLAQVRDVCLAAYSHSDLPFEKLVELLQPDRNLSHTVLFQTYLAMIHQGAHAPRLGGLECEFIGPPALHNGSAKLDLNFVVEDTGRELITSFEYATDLFDASTIERMLRHFELLVRGIVADPDQRVSRLPLLSETERREVLARWSAERRSWPRGQCIHEVFAAQATRTPERIAASCEGSSLTYAELDRRANQLAHHLRRYGAGPDKLVALCLERTLDMVVAILGVLKAGAAYLPLDPAYPKDRIAFVLEDAGAEIIVTQSSLRETIKTSGRHVVELDTAASALGAEPAHAPEAAATADNLAYVIYTSGSTGKPKGVLVTHYNVVRLLSATEAWFHFDADDVWTFFHSYAFDFTVWELWGALLYGGRLVIVPYSVSRSPEAFCQLLYDERVTVLNQTPSAFRQLIPVEARVAGRELALRYVIFGGEALELQSLAPWFARHGDRRPQLVNMFGITETTVHVTYRPLYARDLETAPGSVIGRPIPDLQLYALDSHLEPVPVGVAGELYVGGAGVSRGYLNRPELTRERFLPNPFDPTPGARLYKTGDLARFLPDGDVQYLGRIDHQVQIRGFRVELGEIESALAQHPAVREVCVLARELAPGDLRLLAYVSLRTPGASAGDLREFVKAFLPAHMVPQSVLLLEALPLTRNGKIDRDALPLPKPERAEERDRVVPRNQIEESIARIWCELLRVETIGVDDSFFDAGGHSMLLVQAYTRLKAEFGERTPSMIDLFRHPTIASLAAVIAGVPAVTAAPPQRDRTEAHEAARRQRERRQRR